MVTENQIKIQRIVHWYRYKYKDDPVKQAQLNKILWWSYPIVYPDPDAMNQAHKKLNALYRKKQRVSSRIFSMYESYHHLFFVTLTIDEDHFSDCSERTFHRYASAWFNVNSRDYVANSDYGDSNGRLHFHGVIALLSDKDLFQAWPYGFSYLEPIRSPKSSSRISWYLNKVVNHSGKLSAGRIFSKRGALKEVDVLPF